MRGLALVSMFVAHCAPSPGPLRLFDLSEFLTAPLFAYLIGVGAQLGDRGARALPSAFVRAGVRAAILVVLGLWLETLGAQVDIVLVYLALPTLFAPVLARLPSTGLLALATVSWAAAPSLQSGVAGRQSLAEQRHDELGSRLWQVLFTGTDYRFTGLLVFVCLGIVSWRWIGGGPPRSWQAPAVGAGLLALSVLLLAAKVSHRVSFVPYEGSHLELFFDVTLVVGFALLVLSLLPAHLALPILSVPGAMTLSVYVLQIIYLAWYARSDAPGQRDDSWVNVAVLTSGGLLLPLLWRSLVHREPWSRGPIEGPMALLTRLFR